MNKIIKLSVIGVILTSGLMAADNTSLTRATVKLIQNQNEINKSISELRSLSGTTNELDLKQSNLIKINTEEINFNKTKLTNNENLINKLDGRYKLLVGDIAQVKSTAEKAIAVSNHTSRVLEELSKVSSIVKEKSEMVESATNTINLNTDDLKKSILEIDNILIKIGKLSETNSNKIDENTVKISALESQIRELKVDLEKQKIVTDEKINTLKTVYDSELNIMKAQLEKARPILISNSKVPVKAKNCVKVTEEEETLINKFLGN